MASIGDAAAASDLGSSVKGLDAKDNDAQIIAAARNALACKFADDDGFDGDCDGFKAWGELDAPFQGGKNDATVVNMLEDTDKKVRLLAAMQLEEHGERYKTDAALAGRVLAAGEAEKLEVVSVPLGGAIGEMDLAATKLFDRIASLGKKHPQAEMRGRITARLLDNNPSSDEAYRFTLEMLSDDSPDVRAAAVESLPRGAASRANDTCAKLADVMTKDADGGVAAHAARHLAKMRACSGLYDTLLDTVDQREKADKVHWFYSWALWSMCEDPAASSAQRARATLLGKRIAEDKKETSSARLESLDVIVRCDSSGAWRGYLARFKGDKELGTKARRLLAPAPAAPAAPAKRAP